MEIVWTTLAVDDLTTIYDYLHERDIDAAEGVATAILTTVEQLARFPGAVAPANVLAPANCSSPHTLTPLFMMSKMSSPSYGYCIRHNSGPSNQVYAY